MLTALGETPADFKRRVGYRLNEIGKSFKIDLSSENDNCEKLY